MQHEKVMCGSRQSREEQTLSTFSPQNESFSQRALRISSTFLLQTQLHSVLKLPSSKFLVLAVAMRDREALPSREPNRRGSHSVQKYDERTPRQKPKVADPQNGRDRDSPLPRHRSMVIRPHEREKERDGISSYQGRSRHADKIMSSDDAQNAIRALFMQVKESMAFFTNFKEAYQREIRGIEAYAGHTMLEWLWQRRVDKYNSKGRSTKDRAKDDGVGSYSEFDDVSNRLWASLNDAYQGARSNPSGQNDSMARKLVSAMKDIANFLALIRDKSQEIDNLIKELKVLKVVLELGGAETASGDDRSSPRPRTHAGGPHRRETVQACEDERYEGMREDSGSEDVGQHDEQRSEHSEQSAGRDEREFGGGEEGQGRFPANKYVHSWLILLRCWWWG